MAQTTAERQAAYRARRSTASENGERRLGVWVTTATALGLQRLANRNGLTQRQMLEKLICQADDKVISELDLDSPEWDAYFSR